jgi:type II secretory pathway pseudopilin PulG
MSMSLKLKQRGDTIVEVLIAISVVSLVLTGAMAISNSSLKQIRGAQERSEAQAYAQSTVELLDGYTGAMGTALNDKCLYIDNPAGSISAALKTDKKCEFSIYKQLITYNQTDKSYTVTVSWDGISGNQETLTLAYRTEK